MKVVKNWPPVRYLHELTCQEQSDAELLRRFAESRDEDAFAELVRRTGPQVFRTCCHVLGEATAAEDAFQATFLLLARKANRLTAAGSVAGWLHNTARLIAQDARRAESRRRRHERAAAAVAKPKEEPSWREVRERLDAELAALPEKYRTPLVLCYLQDLTYEQAALRAGCTVGSLRGRLERGKDMLRNRLAKCGLTLGAPVLVIGKPAAVTATLVQATLATVRLGLSGGAIAPAVASLVGSTAWVKGLIASLVVVTVAGAGIALSIAANPPAEPQAKSLPPPKAAERQQVVPVDLLGDPLPPGAVARLGTARFRHSDEVSKVVFAPDGKSLFSVGKDGVRLWEIPSGKQIRSFDVVHQIGNEIRTVAVSPDGKTLATVREGFVRLWEVATAKESFKLGLDGKEVQAMAFHGDSKSLAVVTSTDISVVDIATGKVQQLVDGGERGFRTATFSADGKLVAAGVMETRLFALPSGKELPRLKDQIKGEAREILSLALSLDGKTVVTGEFISTDGWEAGATRVWSCETGMLVHDLQFDGKKDAVIAVALSPDGKLIASAFADKSVHLWDAKTGKYLSALQGKRTRAGRIYNLAFSPDSRLLASGGNGNIVSVWDVASGKPLHDPTLGHERYVHVVAVSRDGKLLASGARDNQVRLWETATGKMRFTFPVKSGTSALAFPPDGESVAVGDTEGYIRIWNATTGKEVKALQTANREVTKLTFSPDGKVLAAASRSNIAPPPGKQKDPAVIQLWDTGSFELRRTLTVSPLGYYSALLFAPDNRGLLTLHDNGKLRRWALDRTEPVAEFSLEGGRVHGTALSGDGRLAATNNPEDGTVFIWDTATGTRRLSMPIANGLGTSLAFSTDHRFLASGTSGLMFPSEGHDRSVRLWELASGKEVLRFDLPTANNVIGMAFSPNGAILHTGMQDTTILAWDLTKGAARASATEKWEQIWIDLAAIDASRAYAAMRLLAATPAQAIPLFSKHLKSVKAPDSKELLQLLTNLDSDNFVVRERATKELSALGEVAEPALRDALKKDQPLEVRRRIETLLGRLASRTTDTPERLEALRAVAVLEWIGTPEASRELQRLAGGAPASWVTQDARAALERLAHKTP